MKILVIQQKMIGDVLTSSILFEAIKKVYPNAELHYLINTHTFPVVQEHPFIDHFHFFTKEHEKSVLKLFQFAFQLRKEDFDVVIDVYSKISSNVITLFSGAGKKISKHKWYTSLVYSHTFKDLGALPTKSGLAIENRLQLLKPLGIDSDKMLRPRIHLTETEKNEARDFLKSQGINLSKPIFMISVLGSSLDKTYPFHYMAEVIDTIALQLPESQILFNYIPSQIIQAKAVFDLCDKETQQHIYFEVFGKSIREFLSITSHCNALIGNEGGAINMAKGLNIPTFAIFSPWISKEAWALFEDDKTTVSVHLKDYNPEYYEGKSIKAIKTNTQDLYDHFHPEKFKSKLVNFLNRI